ncbi:MAG TPA: trimeric intracellular cation channel family protein [Campylobacterales bacterium]|nr:trimeric intracellular cation channel family protein [Campylobacterales bacterium]
MSTALILQAADFIGVVSFALSGFLTGFRHKLDIFGITLLAFLTALGGGIARDVIVGRIPVSMRDLSLCLIVLATLALSIALKLHKKTELDQKLIFVISDAVGLAAFSISGSIVAINAELNSFGVAVLSLLTAVGGGMARDMLVNDVPTILKSEFYATIAIIVGVAMYFMNEYNALNLYTIFLLFIFALAIRIAAYIKEWRLPKLGS